MTQEHVVDRPAPPCPRRDFTTAQFYHCLVAIREWVLKIDPALNEEQRKELEPYPLIDLPELDMLRGVSIQQQWRSLSTFYRLRKVWDRLHRNYARDDSELLEHYVEILYSARRALADVFITPSEFRSHYAQQRTMRRQFEAMMRQQTQNFRAWFMQGGTGFDQGGPPQT